ncbi:MAG: hypothetical protein FJZ60_03180 [Chlamydiae bacterium]|nr:hypothetical protein [Chlamydiota bacterium]
MSEVAGLNPTPHRFLTHIPLRDVNQKIPSIYKKAIEDKPHVESKKTIEARYEPRLTLKDFERLADSLRYIENKDQGIWLVSLYAGLRDFGKLIDPELEQLEGNLPNAGYFLALLSLLEPMPLDLDASASDLAKHFQSCYANLTPTRGEFFNKMFFSAKISATNLKEKLESLRKFSPSDALFLTNLIPLRRQSSASCVLKNLKAAMAHSSNQPSYILLGGFEGHGTYIEIIKGEEGVFFALLHNLGKGSSMHPITKEGKVLPLGLVFKNEDEAIKFILEYRNTKKDYESYQTLIEKAILIQQTPSELKSSGINRTIINKWSTVGTSALKSIESSLIKDSSKKITLAFLEKLRPDLRKKHRLFYSRKKILYSSKDISPYIAI